MAQFIEVKLARDSNIFMFECDREDDTLIINVDHILVIKPEGDRCVIVLADPDYVVCAEHSAEWVLGLINA